MPARHFHKRQMGLTRCSLLTYYFTLNYTVLYNARYYHARRRDVMQGASRMLLQCSCFASSISIASPTFSTEHDQLPYSELLTVTTHSRPHDGLLGPLASPRPGGRFPHALPPEGCHTHVSEPFPGGRQLAHRSMEAEMGWARTCKDCRDDTKPTTHWDVAASWAASYASPQKMATAPLCEALY